MIVGLIEGQRGRWRPPEKRLAPLAWLDASAEEGAAPRPNECGARPGAGAEFNPVEPQDSARESRARARRSTPRCRPFGSNDRPPQISARPSM